MPDTSNKDEMPILRANQNNEMSKDDPKDGNRTSFTLGADGTTAAFEKPGQDESDKAKIEAFGRRGSPAPKEEQENDG
ncbi:hypothetical protein H8M03_08400 [Sphingomonas sabuli]|uniref:Uncharacterized protein n=1 Tax=Sphingomonas sabuli TaxID=2764186 RepID=A0A7G9L0A4_9SPHN|nr:hypothetical protein [Sphingomonas sabuli]QNM82053.1 hypothetical protein H8M03_08400 [Sphingomonas sabuli]